MALTRRLSVVLIAVPCGQRRARGSQPAGSAAEGCVEGEPGNYPDRPARIRFRRQIAASSARRYTVGGYSRQSALALSRYADREGFYAGQPKQEFARSNQVMKQIITTFTILLSLASLVCGDTISLDNGHITFEAPDGFKPVPEEIIRIKYPSSRAPTFVIGNKSAATTVAYDLKPHNITQDKIDEARAAFTKLFPRMIPGLKWRENKTIELSGRKWGYLEMTSTAIDTDIYNIMLFTGYKGQMLVFNFNSTKEEFRKYERALRKSIKTIRIK